MDELDLLQQTSIGYQPLVTGAPSPRLTGMEGVPLLGGGGGPFQAIAGMAMTPYYQRMLGSVGMVPFGVGHDRNVADTMRHMQFTQMQQQAMKLAAESDRATFMQTMQGMAALTGTPFGAQQHQAASTLVNGAVMAAPIMATLMPDIYDAMGGLRGSAAVLAGRTFDAGRFRIDPITGRMGASAETASFQAQRLMNDLYSDANIAQMQGISAGKLGEVYKQLQYRGMVSSAEAEAGYGGFRSGSPYGETRRAFDYMREFEMPGLERAAKATGVDMSKGFESLSAADLDKLMATPDVGNRMRAFDTERVKRSLKSYTDAIAAVKDIFGDNGQPNAPMSVLIQGLEALTAGSAHQIDPGRLNMIVRDVHNLSRNTGVGINGVMMMQNHAANRAAEIGVEPIFAAAATNQALAWSGAYRAGGHGAHQAWGLMTADQLTQLKSNMLVNAAGSETANRLAVFRRVSGIMGGFEANSEAAAIDAAIAAGNDKYEFGGETRDLRISQQHLIETLTKAKGKHGVPSGFTERDIHELLMQRTQNRETTDRDGLMGIIGSGGMQQREINEKVINQTMRNTLIGDMTEQLRSRGMSEADARKKALEMSGQLSASAVERIAKLSTQEFSSADRNLHIGGIIADELEKSGAANALGLSGEDLKRFSVVSADKWYGMATEDLRNSTFGHMKHISTWHRLGNETINNRAVQISWQARLASERQTALSPLGRGTTMRRGFEALRNVKLDDQNAVARALSATFGGVDAQKLTDALRDPMVKAAQMDKAIEAKINEIQATQDPTKRANLEEQLHRMRIEVRGQTEKISEIGAKYGHFGSTSDETQRALRTNHEVAQTQKALEGLIMNPDAAARREGFDKLWRSDQGDTVRRNAGHFVQDMSNISYRLVATPDMAYRLGDKAFEMSEALTKGQDRLNELALMYTNGDMARLLSGDVNMENGKERDEVLREIGDIRLKAQGVFAAVDAQHNKEAPTISEDEKKRLLEKQGEAYDKLTQGGETSLRKIYESFGLTVGEQLTPDQARTAMKLEGGVGRSFARLTLESQETLRKVAEATGRGEGNRGIDNLSRDYADAMAKAEKGDYSSLQSMRDSHLGSDWHSFERAMQFQAKSKLIKLGRDERGKPIDQEFDEILENLRGGGDMMRASSAGPATGPGRDGPLVISGSLTIKGDGTSDINATSGAALGFAAGVC